MTATAPPKDPWTTVPTGPDYLTALRDGWAQSMQQWVDQSTSAWDQWAQWSQGWAGPAPHKQDHWHGRAHGRHASGCCGDACDCCIPKADVVVHARAGEVRVVPFRLANRWRREREVTLAVGPWHGCGGAGLEVRGVLDDEKVVLAPCEDRVVRLLISVNEQATTGADDTTAPGRRTIDVDQCGSAYADVRFEGCSRPLRVAVVVSPADCDPVDVCCDCGCCC